METVPACDWDQRSNCRAVCEGNLCAAQLPAMAQKGQPIVPPEEVDSPALQPIGRVGCNNAARAALDVRHSFAQYFSAEGAVPWQVHDA